MATGMTRCLIVLNLLNGHSIAEIVLRLQVGLSTVDDIAKRFGERGEAGLIDRRAATGNREFEEVDLARL